MKIAILAAITLLGWTIPGMAVAAAVCHGASGTRAQPLLELYTSEGCDSCPPADRWLSEHFGVANTQAIAIAFHVDYWDNLGWKDRFASPQYTARQRRAAGTTGIGFVYTPQFLLDGRDLPWRQGRSADALADAAARPARATLEATAERVGGEIKVRASARIADVALRQGASITVAYEDSGLASDVKAGENRGSRLTHDHVVRALVKGGTADTEGRIVVSVALPLPAEAGSAPALVAFVERERTGEVLQALRIPLTDCPPI